MRKSRVIIFAVILAGMALGGCRPQAPDQPESTLVLPTAMISPTPTITPAREATAVITAAVPTLQEPTQTPEIQQVEADIGNLLDCGEVFCQIQWPGALSRPIGVGFRRTIDYTYPYASKGDGTLDTHFGVEFPNSFGTPVLAAGDGKVAYAGTDALTLLGPYTSFYGNVVIIQHPGVFHDEDLFTLYAHLSVIDVEVGAAVSSGDKIGEVGASGAADGSHLHFEVRLGQNAYDQTLNPILWFAPTSADDGMAGTIAGVIKDQQGNPIPKFDFVVEKLDEERDVVGYYYPKTYVLGKLNAHPDLGENFVLPDIEPGTYRLAFVYGKVYEFYFTLEPGALGWFSIQLD